jgi:glycosyltransferase involved in cell wall biosynthesis
MSAPTKPNIAGSEPVTGDVRPRLRILHLIPTLEGGGAERQLAYLAADHVARGHDVHVASVRGGRHVDVVVKAGAKHHLVKHASNHDPLLLPRIVGLIRRLRPQVVQTWLLQMDVLGGLAALTTRSPWVLTERTSAAFYDFPMARVRRWLGSHATAIVSNSRGGAEYWADTASAHSVIQNGVPLDAIRGVAPSADARRLSPFVLFAGRFSEEKNILVLIDALRTVVPATGARAMICGEGPERSVVERAVSEAKLQDHIHVAGYRTDLWSWMKEASAFVSLSRFEGCPNTVLEAMACGCPLVASDIPAHRDLLDEDCAFIVPVADVTATAAALTTAISNPELARRRAAIASSRITSFSVERVAASYEKLYQTLVTA